MKISKIILFIIISIKALSSHADDTFFDVVRLGGIEYFGTTIQQGYTTVEYTGFSTKYPRFTVTEGDSVVSMKSTSNENGYHYGLVTLSIKDTVAAHTDITKSYTFTLSATNGVSGYRTRATRVEFFDYGFNNPNTLGITYNTSYSAGRSSSTYSLAYGYTYIGGIIKSNIIVTSTLQNADGDSEKVYTHYFGLLVGGDYVNANGTTVNNSPFSIVSGFITIDNIEKSYTNYIHFDANGGTGNMPDQIIFGGESNATLNPCTFKYNDFIFSGWNTEPDGTGTAYIDCDSYTEQNGAVLYAQWRPKSYTLIDGEPYSNSYTATNVDVNYKRNFRNTAWQAWYVPFDTPYSLLEQNFEVAEPTLFKENINGITKLEAEMVTDGILYANKPYLIRAKEVGNKEIQIDDITLYAAENCTTDLLTDESTYSFVGTYNTISNMYEKGYWAMSGGGLKKASSPSATLSSFRWYLQVVANGSASAKAVTFLPITINNDITAIEQTTDIQDKRISPVKYIDNGVLIIKSGCIKYYSDGKAK
ncbi:MAG: InlB B-repeat-containing protein [Lachnospiraceae bacterium]|nr:InlB B-repeat-containing protein [Lachnospiraceae bacterium]